MPAAVHHEAWSESDRVEALERYHRRRYEYVRKHRGPALVGSSVVATVGEPGAGKGLVSTWRAWRLGMMGVRIVSTQSAGLLFGTVVTPDDASSIYSLTSANPNSHVIVDESQSWFNKWDQNSARGQNVAEEIVGRRKSGVSLDVTMQQDRMAPQFLRFEVDAVEFPTRSLYKRVGDGESEKVVPVPGEYDFAKMGAYRAYGRGVMSFRDGPSLLDFVLQRPLKVPDVRWFWYPYDELVEASKLYYTLEAMDVGARHLMDNKEVIQNSRDAAGRRASDRSRREARLN